MDELKYSQQTAFNKAMHYCAYRERAHSEVRKKLYTLGLRGDDLEEVISHLIQAGFVNEARFARVFARDKFNLKGWGRLRIVRGLEHLEISPACIDAALTEIDRQEYLNTLKKLLHKKSLEYAGKKPFERRGRMARYAISRGFEPDLVWELIGKE